MKRIIDGKTYNTETATKIFGWDGTDKDPSDPHGFLFGEMLYQTRYGAFFLYEYDERAVIYYNQPSIDKIIPLTPLQAQEWLEKIEHADTTAIIEQHFGEMPEAGEAESRITLRMPDSLKLKIDAMAKKNNQSTNAWIVKSLEKAIAYERG